MHDLEKIFPNDIFCMIGLHPCYVDDNFDLEIDFVKKQIEKHDYKAIGEIGIDLFHEKKYFEQQVIAFEEQIKLAIDYDLPIVIHSRDSFDEIFEVLEKFKCKKLRGIFHCFTGNIDQAHRIIDLNFHLGIGGVLTFKNGKISEFLKEIPINKIVLENLLDRESWKRSATECGVLETLEVEGQELTVKMDTGNNTTTCALHADDLTVKNKVVSWTTEGVKYKEPLHRYVELLKPAEKRPVVLLEINFLNTIYEVEVSLDKRNQIPFLANRDFMKRANLMINPARKFMLTNRNDEHANG